MRSANPHLRRELQIAQGYGAAVLAVLEALLISHWPFLHLEFAPVLLFLCAVVQRVVGWCRFGITGYRSFCYRLLLQLPAPA